MKVYIDPDLCTGCGPCVDVCPEVFELNDEEIAVVKMKQVPANLRQTCLEAVESCPTEAISIEE